MNWYEIVISLLFMWVIAIVGYAFLGQKLYDYTQRKGWRGFNLDD